VGATSSEGFLVT